MDALEDTDGVEVVDEERDDDTEGVMACLGDDDSGVPLMYLKARYATTPVARATKTDLTVEIVSSSCQSQPKWGSKVSIWYKG